MAGGQHSATGNVIGKHSEEGNFSYDPESAYLVLKVHIFLCERHSRRMKGNQTCMLLQFKQA